MRTVAARSEPRSPGRSSNLLATYVLRERTRPSGEEAKDYVRTCLRSIFDEQAVDAFLYTKACRPAENGGYLFRTNLMRPGDVFEMMDGFIRHTGNEQFLDFPARYEIKYSQVQTGKPAEPTCIALVFGPDPEQFDPHLIDAASIRQSQGNFEEAARLLRPAAEQGMAQAQYNLGIQLYEGRGIPKDFAQAVQWFQSAATQDYANAVYMLAFMRENGYGCVKDLRAAFELYKRGANLNEADSQCKLALLLLDAHLQRDADVSYRNEGWNFVPADHDKARVLLLEASGQGHALARRVLNSLFGGDALSH